jgi:cell division protein FtsB
MRWLVAVLTIVLIAMLYRLGFGKNSVPDYFRLKQEVEHQKAENKELAQRNKLLYADVEDLKMGLEAIEERARNDLGMIKQGESFYRVVRNNK